MPRVFGYPAAGFFMLALARRLLGDRATPGELQTVLRGLPHNVTTEMDLELWQLARNAIRADQTRPGRRSCRRPAPSWPRRYRARALPPVAQRGLTAFLRRYGHRAVAEIDLGMPRWSDDPSHIIGVIANYLRLDDPELAPDAQFERRRAPKRGDRSSSWWRRLRDEHRPGADRGFALRRARQLVGLRESPKYLLVVALGLLREPAAAGRRRRRRARAASTPRDDIFFLDSARRARALRGEPLPADGRRTAGRVRGRAARRRHPPACCCPTAPSPRRWR